MALETFNWSPRVNPSQDVTMRTREAQFGDGYTQTSGDGLNPPNESSLLSPNRSLQAVSAPLHSSSDGSLTGLLFLSK